MRSPFGWFEGHMVRWFAGPGSPALVEDTQHLGYIQSKSGENHLDALMYLYNRLSIVDAKANTLLAVNVLSLGIVTFIATVSQKVGVKAHPLIKIPALAAVVTGSLAILLALATSRLQFDHVTATHPEATYLDDFLTVTIARVKMLAAARLFTSLSFALYAVFLIVSIVVQ
ncbi:MAG TPA: hypothetical protein VFW71_07510 [Actinomycetota bacterium]|nr:hypothetical protein [Actinomycetota bacterium]